MFFSVKTYTALVALEDKTAAVMQKEKDSQAKLNEGLWLRYAHIKTNCYCSTAHD